MSTYHKRNRIINLWEIASPSFALNVQPGIFYKLKQGDLLLAKKIHCLPNQGISFLGICG
mgnify:CR=1 FL=1